MKGLIYKCICNCNGKVYIGQTIQTFDERKRSHIKEAFNDQCPGYNYHFHRALRKYRLDNFTWEIIASGKISEVCSGKRKSAGKFNGRPIYWEKVK